MGSYSFLIEHSRLDRRGAVEAARGFEGLGVEVLAGTAFEATHVGGTAGAEGACQAAVLAAEQPGNHTEFFTENFFVEHCFLKFQVLKNVL